MTDLEPLHDPELDRWCRFCGIDCSDGATEHDPECPHVAGFGVARGDECCDECGVALVPGESYVSATSGRTRVGTPIADIVCVGCALTREPTA